MKEESLTEEEREAFRETLLQQLAAKLVSEGAVSIPIDDVAKALGLTPEEMREAMEEDPDTGHVH